MRKIKKFLCLVVAMVLICTYNLPAAAAAAFPEQQAGQSISRAMAYFHRVQNPDGGFSVQAGRSSNATLTSWVVLAITAAGENAGGSSWAPQGNSPVDFLRGSKTTGETNDYARLLLALSAAGQGPVHQDVDLAARIASLQQANGQFAQFDIGERGFINSHVWSILALASAGQPIPQADKARQWLLSRQNDDGGFGWIEGMASDADDTAVAIQALVVMGEEPAGSAAIGRALQYLKKCQGNDGGFTPGDEWMGSKTNAATDAWVLQGLIAAGENPVGEAWTINENNPVTHLLSLQNSDGSFKWTNGVDSSPVTMTAYAVIALSQKPFPLQADNGAGPVTVPDTARFLDLPVTYWAYTPIMNLVQKGILSGYPDGTFQPDKTVSRAEFTLYILGGLDQREDSREGTHTFPDLSAEHWAYRYVQLSADKGYITGMPDGSFRPDGAISGAELATILVKALPAEKWTPLPAGPIWYSGYVQVAAEQGLLAPGFDPQASATRAQCAYSVDQLIRLLANQ